VRWIAADPLTSQVDSYDLLEGSENFCLKVPHLESRAGWSPAGPRK
jgi:hypothetical protein